MAASDQLKILKDGVRVWNNWRNHHRNTNVRLAEANFSNINLAGVNFNFANLRGANLRNADLMRANLSRADLRNADLIGANLTEANLAYAKLEGAILDKSILTRSSLKGSHSSGASFVGANLWQAVLRKGNFEKVNFRKAKLEEVDLREANLMEANLQDAFLRKTDLRDANLSSADLGGADLSYSILVNVRVDKARISGSNVYGISVWDIQGEFSEQNNLIVTPDEKFAITVDDIEVAQLIYLILNNKKMRQVIDTLTSKTVLILGRFAVPERKSILNALRNKLREYNLLPIVFDFERPLEKDFTETIKILAGISSFVIADVTNPKSSPLELQATVPDFQIPFVPIIQEGEQPFSMMVDLQKKYNWVLNTRTYDSVDTLMNALKTGIINPALKMRDELRIIKAQEQAIESLNDYV